MKNIHIIPTDKPSKVFIHNAFNDLRFDVRELKHDNNQHIYITSDEEIKDENWYINLLDNKLWKAGPNFINTNGIIGSKLKKIILTTDQNLIKDGVQAIEDEFLEWFVKNPSCEEIEVKMYCCQEISKVYCDLRCGKQTYKIIIPKEEPEQEQKELREKLWNVIDMIESDSKQETLELPAEIIFANEINQISEYDKGRWYGRIEGANWQAEKMYSEEEVLKIIKEYAFEEHLVTSSKPDKWFELFKKK